MIRSVLVVGSAELSRYAADVQRLLVRTKMPTTTWWRATSVFLHHHPHLTPWAVLLWSGDELIGAALLARSRRFGTYKFAPIGEANVPSCVAAVDAASADLLAAAVAERLRAIKTPWRLRLTMLEVADPVVTGLTRRLGCAVTQFGIEAPRLHFERGQGINEYLSRNTRSAAAKARNRIKKDELDLEIAWVIEPTEIVNLVPTIVDVYRDRNAQLKQNVGLLDNVEYRNFYSDTLRAFAADGRARLLTLRLNGAIAAFAMCLQHDDLLYVSSNRIAPAWDRYSPGLLANAEVVRAAFEDPALAGVDWGVGVQRYKLSGHAELHPYLTLSAWSSRGWRYASESLAPALAALRRGSRLRRRQRVLDVVG